ncbi:hypothetical protein ACLQ3K_26330 [Tsukamurella sp. DT100]
MVPSSDAAITRRNCERSGADGEGASSTVAVLTDRKLSAAGGTCHRLCSR